MNIETLLAPISGSSPSGGDLRNDVGTNSLYFRLKDARGQARAAEREAESSGEAAALSPAWNLVRTLAVEALARHSKDIEVAAWLAEALVRGDGFAGLTDAFTLIDALVERFWPNLFSPDRDDVASILMPISGLNGMGSDGPLVQAIRMVSLIPGCAYGSHSLWHCSQAFRAPDSELNRELTAARAAAGSEAMRARSGEARAAHNGLIKVAQTLDARCGADAPPTSKLRGVLEEVLDAYRVLLGSEAAAAPVPEAATPPDMPETPVKEDAVITAPPLPYMPRDISTREQAFAEMLRIADFFRRSEPHSPISYAMETLVRRGRMELADLLAELLPDAATRLQFLVHAGIQTQADGAAKKTT